MRARNRATGARSVVYFGCRLYLTALLKECGLSHERRHVLGIRLYSFCTPVSAAASSLGFCLSSVNARNFLASAAWEESGLFVRTFCIASRASLTFPKP